MFMLFLLGLHAIHINIIKIQNCPPKDIFNGAKLGVATVARTTPLLLPRPEIMYKNMFHISAPPRTYLVCATPVLSPDWRHWIFLKNSREKLTIIAL